MKGGLEEEEDPFSEERRLEELMRSESAAAALREREARSESAEALDNSLQLLALLQDHEAGAAVLPSRDDDDGCDPFLDEVTLHHNSTV